MASGRGDYEAVISYGSDRNQLHIAHTRLRGVEAVALTCLHTVRIIRAGSATCLTPHALAPHGDRVVLSTSWNGRAPRIMLKSSLVMVRLVIMIVWRQVAGFFNPRVSATNESSLPLRHPSKVLRCSQPLKTLQNFLGELENYFPHSPLHEKHQKYDLCDLETAISRVSRWLQVPGYRRTKGPSESWTFLCHNL